MAEEIRGVKKRWGEESKGVRREGEEIGNRRKIQNKKYIKEKREKLLDKKKHCTISDHAMHIITNNNSMKFINSETKHNLTFTNALLHIP